MARRSTTAAVAKGAKEILRTRCEAHPTIAATMGLHRYDGRLPDYSPGSLKRRAPRAARQLRALEALERRGGLPPPARLELGVLKGMLMTERFDLLDLREPHTLPPYFLYRLSIVNYLLRSYAPLDRRLRAIARMQSQVPRYLRDLRAATDRRLPETFYEMGEMAARGMGDADERGAPQALADAAPAGPPPRGDAERGPARDARGDPPVPDRPGRRLGPVRGAGSGDRDPAVLPVRERRHGLAGELRAGREGGALLRHPGGG